MWGIFVASIPSGTPSHGGYIGCTDIWIEGAWVCDGDSSEIQYRAEWLTRSHFDRHCAVMSVYFPYWNDMTCDDWKYAMCERPLPTRCSYTARAHGSRIYVDAYV